MIWKCTAVTTAAANSDLFSSRSLSLVRTTHTHTDTSDVTESGLNFLSHDWNVIVWHHASNFKQVLTHSVSLSPAEYVKRIQIQSVSGKFDIIQLNEYVEMDAQPSEHSNYIIQFNQVNRKRCWIEHRTLIAFKKKTHTQKCDNHMEMRSEDMVSHSKYVFKLNCTHSAETMGENPTSNGMSIQLHLQVFVPHTKPVTTNRTDRQQQQQNAKERIQAMCQTDKKLGNS